MQITEMLQTLFKELLPACILIFMFLAVAIPIIMHSTERYQSHEQYSNGVVNHNFTMREFRYKVEKSKAEIWEILNHHDMYAPLKYEFNAQDSTIVFYSDFSGISPGIKFTILLPNLRNRRF